MKVKISDSTMAMSMRKVVRAAYSGRLLGSSDTGRILQLGQRLEQMPTGLGQEHQEAEDQQHGKHVPARKEAPADGNRHIQPHIRDAQSKVMS